MLIYLIILQVPYLSLCYDIELEGVVRVQQDLLNKLNGYEYEDPHRIPMRYSLKRDVSIPLNLLPVTSAPGTRPSYNEPLRHYPLKLKNIISEVLLSRKSFNETFVFNYMKNLTEKGVRSLKLLAKSVKEQLNLSINDSKIIEPIISDYTAQVRNHFKIIEKLPTEYENDRKFVLLDMVETSNKILYSGKKKLINEIVTKNNADIEKVQNIILRVFKESVYDKRDEFNYICDKVKVCYTYPGFSDYIGDLMSEILKLDHTKFGLAMNQLRKLVNSKVNFLKTIISDEVMVLIGDKMKPTSEKDLEMREMLTLLRAVIVQRYKLVQSNDEGVKMRTSAIRTLLSIIDKAFGMEDETIMNMHFDSTVKGLRHYGAGYRMDVDSIINTFVNHVVGVLKHHLNKSTKDEVKTLTEIIITGTSKDIDRFRYLFTRGSKFIREV